MVTFIIGKEALKFQVHKDFACHYSPVFRAAFENDRFIEGETQTYTLVDVKQGVFHHLVNWLYSQRLDIDLENLEDEERVESLRDLVELWVLGDRLFIPALQNQAMHLLFSVSKSIDYPTNVLHYIYKNTQRDSTLRMFMVKDCAYGVGSSDFRLHQKDYPREMLLEVVEMFMDAIPDDFHDEQFLGMDVKHFEVPEEC